MKILFNIKIGSYRLSLTRDLTKSELASRAQRIADYMREQDELKEKNPGTVKLIKNHIKKKYEKENGKRRIIPKKVSTELSKGTAESNVDPDKILNFMAKVTSDSVAPVVKKKRRKR